MAEYAVYNNRGMTDHDILIDISTRLSRLESALYQLIKQDDENQRLKDFIV